jgi:hypothetical protein
MKHRTATRPPLASQLLVHHVMISSQILMQFDKSPAAAPVIKVTGKAKVPKRAFFWFTVTGINPEGQRVKGTFNEFSFREALELFDSNLIHNGSLWISTDGIWTSPEKRTLLRRKGPNYYHVEADFAE